jgi:hypothetical protein
VTTFQYRERAGAFTARLTENPKPSSMLAVSMATSLSSSTTNAFSPFLTRGDAWACSFREWSEAS